MGPGVRFEGVSKRYGPIRALDGVTFACRPGEIRAIVGENGAGKSTLMEALGGFVRLDEGQIWLDDVPLRPGDSRRPAGVAMVHQHFMLVPEFTVEENLALGALHEAGSRIDVREMARPALDKGRSLGWDFEPRDKAGRLSVGQQQRLEILKALATGARVLILDEPTAVLREEEVEELFRVLRGLRDEGHTLLLVAHKLAEVLAVADRIAVLRAGRLAADVNRDEADPDKLAHWMLGELIAAPTAFAAVPGEVRIRAERVSVRGDRGELRVDNVSFEVHAGEVLGISGVEGNGQTELAEVMAGIRSLDAGTLEAPAAGYIPQDRHRDGLALEMSIEENLLIEGHRRADLRQGPFLAGSRIAAWAEGLRQQFQVAAPHARLPVRALSGGNQQKVVVARTLDGKPPALVAVNPTRGLDVRAAAFVRERLRKAAQDGAAVVLFSTDRDELDEASTRRLFMNGGRLYTSEAAALAGGKS